MKAVVEMTKAESEHYSKMYRNLMHVIEGVTRSALFTVNRKSGYAHYEFRGEYTPLLEERLGHKPTADEIIILVDNGYSHFGASCSIFADRTFKGRVNID